MKIVNIYINIKGVSTEVINNEPFENFNWDNFRVNDPIYLEGELFGYFMGYINDSEYGDETIKIEIR